MTMEERKMYEKTNCGHHKYWLPIQWCHTWLNRAKREDMVLADYCPIVDVMHRKCTVLLSLT